MRAPLLIGLLILVAGCSASPGLRSVRPPDATVAGSAAPSLDPTAKACALLSLEEAQTAFGQTFNTPVGSDAEPGFCQYLNGAGFGLQIEVSRAPTIQADFDQDKADLGPNAKDLAGVGDKAFEYLQGRRQITFIKGDEMVTVFSASRIEPDAFRELAKTIAGRV